MPFSFGDEPLMWGTSAQASCYVVEGDLPLQITWTFHGPDVTTHTQKGIQTSKFGQRSSIILIDPVEFSGNFTCSAKNVAGSNNFTTDLIVQSVLLFSSFRANAVAISIGYLFHKRLRYRCIKLSFIFPRCSVRRTLPMVLYLFC